MNSEDVLSWFKEWSLIGGAGVITSMLASFGTYRLTRANVHKIEVETRVTETKAETEILEVEAKRSVEFERVINDRVARLIDSLEKQVVHLTEVIESQSKQILSMETEIRDLRKALDTRSESQSVYSQISAKFKRETAT